MAHMPLPNDTEPRANHLALWCGRRSDRVVHRNPSAAPRVAIK